MSIEELLASANPYAADQIAWELEMEIDRLERSSLMGDWRDIDTTREIISQQIADLIRLASARSQEDVPYNDSEMYDPAQISLF
jgi:hypothetical protein